MRNWIDMSYLPTGGITRDMSDQASPTRILTSSNLRRARFRFRVPVFPLRTNLSEFRGLPLARFLRNADTFFLWQPISCQKYSYASVFSQS